MRFSKSKGRHSSVHAKAIFHGIRGYNSGMSKIYKSILAYSISDEAKFRLEVINHFKTYGLKPTKDAFKVSRATIYRWQRRLWLAEGQLKSLISGSRRPLRGREMRTDLRILGFIRQLRELHPRIGKAKIKPLLDQYCQALRVESVSGSTIGKIITRNRFYYQRKDSRYYHSPDSKMAQKKINYKTKVRKSPCVISSGYVEIDTVALFVGRIKAYIYHAIDVQNRFAFAYSYSRLNSVNTVDFLDKLKQVYPLATGIRTIQTDNGLEFLGEFDKRLKKEGVNHFFIYPRCPKINGFIERANRSLREEFLNQNQELIETDFGMFNQKLLDHLFWYNTSRPHQALKFLSPIDYLLKRCPESQMYTTRTTS